MRRSAELRAFLDTTSLFSEGLPAAALGRIVESVSERHFRSGESILGEDLQAFNIIRSGRIERRVGSRLLDDLKERDLFGEEGAIFKVPYLSDLRAREETSVIQIPGALLGDVPILRWKLLESYQQRAARVVYSGDPTVAFSWRDAFSVQVAEIDNRHRRLIEIANAIMKLLNGNAGRDCLARAFDDLAGFSRDHFSAEEKQMAAHGYPGVTAHAKKHSDLLNQVTEFTQRVVAGDTPDKASFLYMFESWLVRHILNEDHKYGAFLNGKGVV
jgi:hemerythrin